MPGRIGEAMFYTNSLIRWNTEIKGDDGEGGWSLVKNHGLFHRDTGERDGTPWIGHRGEEKHDRGSNYKLEEFNLIEGCPRTRPRSFAKLGQRAARLQ